MKKGLFVISLDYESLWGAIGGLSDNANKAFVDRVSLNDVVIPRLLDLFNKYDIHATWAMVGALTCTTREEVKAFIPKDIKYIEWGLSIHDFIDSIKEEEIYYYINYSLREKIEATPNQELASHTFTHFYCNNVDDNRELMQQEIDAFNKSVRPVTSIVFPRNMVNPRFMDVLARNGYTAYRGLVTKYANKPGLFKKVVYFVNSYLPIFDTTYPIEDVLVHKHLYDIKASLLFRTWFNKLSWFDGMKVWRVKREMRRAAKEGRVFHLWWHPHNMATKVDYNFRQLEKILKCYQQLQKQFNLQSCSMREVCDIVKQHTFRP